MTHSATTHACSNSVFRYRLKLGTRKRVSAENGVPDSALIVSYYGRHRGGQGRVRRTCGALMQATGAPNTHPGRKNGIDCSVLVPVLNEERHIVDSVAAMRRQRFGGEVEFVLVDGGSTDRTRSILEELARQDPRLRVFDNPGRSTPSGLNVGLRHARGHWVARMDAHTA